MLQTLVFAGTKFVAKQQKPFKLAEYM